MKVFIALLSTALCLCACHSMTVETAPQIVDTVTATAAPDFTLQDINGVTHHLSDYRGKVVVLNFWATWCPPCKKEIPSLISLESKDSLRGLQLLGIALDDEGVDKVKPWAEGHGVNYPTLLPDTSICSHYGGISSIPTTFFIDRKGRLRNSAIGMRSKEDFDTLINPLLTEQY